MSLPVAIIGAGPAGVTAAVQLKRSGIPFLLLEKGAVGGLLLEAERVENFPAIAAGISGRALAARLRRQLEVAGIGIQMAQVLSLARRGGAFVLRTQKREWTAAWVILACGTRPIPCGPPLDQPWLGGRLFDSILPLQGCVRQSIAVIGGGDAACDYALNLARKNRVHLVMRSRAPRALPLLVERCRRNARITIHEQAPLTGVRPAPEGDGVILQTRRGEIACRRVLTAVGRAPALDFLAPQLRAVLPELIARGRIRLVGDAGNGRFRQAAIAAADGLRAAMEMAAGGTR
jgi:thioredoxin reductase